MSSFGHERGGREERRKRRGGGGGGVATTTAAATKTTTRKTTKKSSRIQQHRRVAAAAAAASDNTRRRPLHPPTTSSSESRGQQQPQHRRVHRLVKRRKREKEKNQRRRRPAVPPRDEDLNFCNDCTQILVGAIHMIDVLGGLTLFIYGSIVAAQPNAPPEAVSILILFGSVLTITSTMGIAAFGNHWCERVGLIVSAYGGALIGLIEVVSIICIGAMKEDFFQYLHDNRKALLMSERSVNNLENIFGLLVFITVLCAVIEVCRFFTLRSLLHQDILQNKNVTNHQTDTTGSRNRRAATDGGHDDLNKLLGDLTDPLLLPHERAISKRKTIKINNTDNDSKGAALYALLSNELSDDIDDDTTTGKSANNAADDESVASSLMSGGGEEEVHRTGRGNNWFTRHFFFFGGGNNEEENVASTAAVGHVVKGNDNDDDDESLRDEEPPGLRGSIVVEEGEEGNEHSVFSSSSSSADEFAPVDETISTEGLWWSQTERDERIRDYSWVNVDRFVDQFPPFHTQLPSTTTRITTRSPPAPSPPPAPQQDDDDRGNDSSRTFNTLSRVRFDDDV